ncbi:hypothetical protein GLYMA_10G130052v4 [Glycine max]|nr:hypothetical protein GLYMA_10G130052v4 [Glycine max]KAH1138013.1 hypothetical protein GYH30_027852 [Glycine max]
MLGIFKEKLVKAPKELNSPASLNSCTKPKPSHEILKDFMPCNSSNAFSMCFGNDALLAYSPSNKPSIHHRLFSGLDNIYCVYQMEQMRPCLSLKRIELFATGVHTLLIRSSRNSKAVLDL